MAGGETQFPARVTAAGGAKLGKGANYSQFSSGGRFTSYGSARATKDEWLPALIWDASDANACPSVSNAGWPVININPSAATEVVPVRFAWRVPRDAATTCDLKAFLECESRVGSGSSQWAIKWDYIGEGESTGTAGSGTLTATYTGSFHRTTASLRVTNHPVQDDLAMLTVQYNGAGESGSKVNFYGLRMRFVSDRFGQTS